MRTASLRWQPAPLARQLIALSTVGLALALATRRAELVALAAPALLALVAGSRAVPARRVEVSATVEPRRCFEGEPVHLRVTVSVDAPVGELSAELALTCGLEVPARARRAVADEAEAAVLEVVFTPTRWGRWSPGVVTVAGREAHRLRSAAVVVGLDTDILVFPRPARSRAAAVPSNLPYGVGDHASRQSASGIEFAGIRRYVAGDPVRRINWPVSTRLGSLHVTTHAAERPVEVVVALDAFTDVGPAGRSSLDLAVRGATGLASTYLRQRDRVGLVVLGGRLQWLTPGIGERQFYRVIEAVMAVRRDSSFLQPQVAHVPRAALPPSALVVVFSALLDDRILEMIRDLRQRGAQVAVVDVLTVEPPDVGTGRRSQLALRLWRLEREAMRYRLADLGIGVRRWDGDGPVDPPAARRPAGGTRIRGGAA